MSGIHITEDTPEPVKFILEFPGIQEETTTLSKFNRLSISNQSHSLNLILTKHQLCIYWDQMPYFVLTVSSLFDFLDIKNYFKRFWFKVHQGVTCNRAMEPSLHNNDCV